MLTASWQSDRVDKITLDRVVCVAVMAVSEGREVTVAEAEAGDVDRNAEASADLRRVDREMACCCFCGGGGGGGGWLRCCC